MSKEAAEATEAQRDPHVEAAIEEEQRLLNEATKNAQLQYLINRCVSLNADRRRVAGEQAHGD